MQNVIRKSITDAMGGTRTEAKQQALSWLAKQLQWENTLGHLREGDDVVVDDAKAA
jgi:hypothetical protein